MSHTASIVRTCILLSCMAMQPAWGVRPTNEAAGAATATIQPVRYGIIQSIDLARTLMVVNGVSYVYSASSTVVHAPGAPGGGNGLRLAQGDRIRFSVQRESIANKDRIMEVWLLDSAPAAPRKK